MLGGIRSVLPNSDAHLVWVDADFLEQNKVRPWSDMPVWIPPRGGQSVGFSRRSIDRALAKGLTFRPLAETVKDTLAYYAQQPEERRAALRAGLAAEREREVLAAWKPVAASRQKA
jgi:2'-hydroxyisoflavone reductase